MNKLIAFTFSLLVLLFYFSFILIIGFKPELFGVLIGNSYVTIGIVIGLFIIVFSIFITLIFTFISNNYLDKIRDELNK